MPQLRGVVVVILAFGVSVCLVLLVVETMLHVGPISSQESTVLSTVLGATIGAIATYLGGHALERRSAGQGGEEQSDDQGQDQGGGGDTQPYP